MDSLETALSDITNPILEGKDDYLKHLEGTIETNQELIAHKDEMIISLQESLLERDEQLREELKMMEDNEEMLKRIVDEKEKSILKTTLVY